MIVLISTIKYIYILVSNLTYIIHLFHWNTLFFFFYFFFLETLFWKHTAYIQSVFDTIASMKGSWNAGECVSEIFCLNYHQIY